MAHVSMVAVQVSMGRPVRKVGLMFILIYIFMKGLKNDITIAFIGHKQTIKILLFLRM